MLAPKLAALPVKEFTFPADPKEMVPVPPMDTAIPVPGMPPAFTSLDPTDRSNVVLLGRKRVLAKVTPPDSPRSVNPYDWLKRLTTPSLPIVIPPVPLELPKIRLSFAKILWPPPVNRLAGTLNPAAALFSPSESVLVKGCSVMLCAVRKPSSPAGMPGSGTSESARTEMEVVVVVAGNVGVFPRFAPADKVKIPSVWSVAALKLVMDELIRRLTLPTELAAVAVKEPLSRPFPGKRPS